MNGHSCKALTRKPMFCIVMAVLLTACSSSDDEDNNEPAVLELSGEYAVEAVAETEFDINGGTCGDASGSVTITDNAVRGSVLSTNGFTLGVDGTLTDAGEVAGGFAQGSQTVASFSGSFNETSGSGEWEDSFGCKGTWSATKTPEQG